MNFSRLRRLWHIHRVAHKYGLTEFAGRKPTRKEPRGERLRLALEELGPVFIKMGQALSTRPDILPADIAVELTKLQDQVPPFPGEDAQAEIERALGQPVAQLFESFDVRPLASASVAQVHAARLKPVPGSAPAGVEPAPGLEVIVKVLRPGIEGVIRRDIALLLDSRVAPVAAARGGGRIRNRDPR
jgi:ubiquinone biosynthesis protein